MIIDLDNSVNNIVRSRMSRQMLIHPPSPTSSSSSSANRHRPLLRHARSSASANSSCSARFGEVAGGTTAECAAICCCCPCGLANILFLTIYKVPTLLCRRALKRKRRQRLIKNGLLPQRRRRCQCGCDDTEIQIHPSGRMEDSMAMMKLDDDNVKNVVVVEEEESLVKLENEMWETFYAAGFWRNPSQKEIAPMKSPTISHFQVETLEG